MIPKYKVGDRVQYKYAAPAISCQENGKVVNREGIINRVYPHGYSIYIGGICYDVEGTVVRQGEIKKCWPWRERT
jgi:hypothetical protein